MTPIDQIRFFDWRSHVSAWEWIGLTYRSPMKVEEAGKSLSRRQTAEFVTRIYVHALPYFVFLSILGRWIVAGLLGEDADLGPQRIWLEIFGVGIGLIASLAFGVAFGVGIGLANGLSAVLTVGLTVSLAFGITVGVTHDLAVNLLAGLIGGFAVGVPVGFAVGHAVALTGGRTVGLTVGLVFGLVLAVTGGLVFGFKENVAAGWGSGIGWTIGYYLSLLRIYYFPLHFLCLWPRPHPRAYRRHPVAWDAACLVPFPGLDRLLVALPEQDREHEINRLIDEYPSQRNAALRAQAILVARRAAATTDLSHLDEVLATLPEGEKDFLKETPALRRRAHEITVLQARLNTLGRPFLREPFAALLVKEVETFIDQIAGFKPPLSVEMRKAARNWLANARSQLDDARTAVTREPTHQVFRAGDPVDREHEAFVVRAGLLSELERQVLLATGCPGLVIYGRRRMGKSTLVRNLKGFLPPRVSVALLSMQQASAFTSLPDLLRLMGERVADALPDISEVPSDLRGLERLLDATRQRLEDDDRRLLLAIDEYENLDRKIGEGVLPEDLLAVVRESIQTHRRLIWAFAGSHSIDELTHAPWTSYLVSARTIEVTPFEEAETRLLLTEPLKHSSLWRDAEAERPRFEPGFWGDGGIERIHAEAAGWPHLVQLIAETAVDLVNDAGVAGVDAALLERALSRAVVRGNNVFLELLEKESRLPGEWDYLRAFRSADEQAPPSDEAVARSLRRRLLVVEEDGRYRLRVPLMGRWLRERL